jgi:hypothetical protein
MILKYYKKYDYFYSIIYIIKTFNIMANFTHLNIINDIILKKLRRLENEHKELKELNKRFKKDSVELWSIKKSIGLRGCGLEVCSECELWFHKSSDGGREIDGCDYCQDCFDDNPQWYVCEGCGDCFNSCEPPITPDGETMCDECYECGRPNQR